jgi:class 3 adenylate cyclase
MERGGKESMDHNPLWTTPDYWQKESAVTLRFKPALEQLFLTDYAQRTLLVGRIACVMGTALYAIFGFLDPWVFPQSLKQTWFIRFGVIEPIMISITLFSFTPYFARHMQIALMALAITASSGVYAQLIAAYPIEPGFTAYCSGLLLITLWAYTIARLRFVYASLTGWLITVGYILTACIDQSVLSQGANGVQVAQFMNNVFMLLSSNIIGMIAGYKLEYHIRRDFLTQHDLADAQARTEQLLVNMLPVPIAKRLLEGNGHLVDRCESVSVLFADVVGFTQLAKRYTPERLVQLLESLFGRFDALVHRHGLEKIKTIGDCYMVAGGLLFPQPNHANTTIELAQDMLKVMADINRDYDENLELRIGVSTGPVVAGVIGQLRFTYDLWGDTANTASRMESHGVPGRIQISEWTRTLLGETYEYESRGPIFVKGQGGMQVYLIKGQASAPAMAST